MSHPGIGSRTSAALCGSRQMWLVSCGRSSLLVVWTSTVTLNGPWNNCWRSRGPWRNLAPHWTRQKVCGKPGNRLGTSSLIPYQTTSKQPRYSSSGQDPLSLSLWRESAALWNSLQLNNFASSYHAIQPACIAQIGLYQNFIQVLIKPQTSLHPLCDSTAFGT